VKVLTGEQYITAESGLIYLDLVEGTGEQPKDGQQVSSIFNSHSSILHIHFVHTI
jgi:FKBP-type peptidyl-prolyl cis-trans isomerase